MLNFHRYTKRLASLPHLFAICQLSTALYAYMHLCLLTFFMAYDVTTVNGFTISPEVSLFFRPSANFRLLVCSEVSEVTEKTLNASQIYFGFLILKVLQRIVEVK